nr:hypothetical protein [uncultured Bacillus sp.]
MKKNTGCSHPPHGCPPASENDKAKTKTVECRNKSFAAGTLYVPVVLAEVELSADVEASIELPTAAREIKSIRKNVSLSQCKAIPSFVNTDAVKLFITGIVHKNIQYVEECTGHLRDHSVDVPFHCNQQVAIFVEPDYFFSNKSTATEEYRFLDKSGHRGDRCQFGQFTFENYNEPIECKLLFSFVHELDLLKEFDHFGAFKKVTEKMEVFLMLKLIQNQQFNPALGSSNADSVQSHVYDRIRGIMNRSSH